MEKKIKVRLTKIFYTWHPDFVNHDDGTWEVFNTGRFVVEWDIVHEKDSFHRNHYTADCATEEQAKTLCNILAKKHENLSPWVKLAPDDISLTSGVFVRVGRGGKIIAKTDATKTTVQKQS